MSAVTTTPMSIELRPSRLVGLLVAAAVASAALTLGVVLAVDADSGIDRADEVNLGGLSQAYVDGLSALPSGELAWAYRSTPSWAVGLAPHQRAYVEGIRSMTPEELHAAFSRRLDETSVVSASPDDDATRAAYVEGIIAMSPEELRAAFGWHSDRSN